MMNAANSVVIPVDMIVWLTLLEIKCLYHKNGWNS